MFPSVKTLNLLQKRLFQVLVFLLPSQLALHFWPNWAFIFGIRVDYLSPALYLTDLLLIGVLGLWLFQERNIEIKKERWLWLIIVVGFIFINLFVAERPEVAVYKWVKYFVFFTLSVFIAQKKEFNFHEWIEQPIKTSLATISLIGIFQFISQKSIGGLFYFLGERDFSSITPGIALSSFLGKQYLRAYSIFSHPNSFAGFLLVALILIYFDKKKFKKRDYLVLALSLLALLITFSRAAILIGAMLVVFRYLVKSKELFTNSFKHLFLITGVVVSVLMPVIAEGDLKFSGINETVEKRVVLAKAAGEMVATKPVFGVGLNNFVTLLPTTSLKTDHSWDLQPVHNVFLLVLAETGILGLTIFFLGAKKIFKTNDERLFYSLLAIILTGLVDHYWLTLQQNSLLLFTVMGLSLRTSNGDS